MKSIQSILLYAVTLWTGLALGLPDGTLDKGFNVAGRMPGSRIQSLGDHAAIKATAVRADGKIVAAGFSNCDGKNRFALARFNADGSLDDSFGKQGRVTTSFGADEMASCAQALLLLPDGKIFAAGFSDAVHAPACAMARYNEDGSLDHSFFGEQSIILGTALLTLSSKELSSEIAGLALQADGKIVGAATCCDSAKGTMMAVIRMNQDGSLDKSFNCADMPGIAYIDFGSERKSNDRAHAIAMAPGGKIVIAGSSDCNGARNFALARLNANGMCDTSFFNKAFSKKRGTVLSTAMAGETNAAIHSIIVHADGSITAGGYSNSNCGMKNGSRFALARYLPCGSLDKNFGGAGLSCVPGIAISSLGKEEVAGVINCLLMQNDGKMIAVGTCKQKNKAYCALARYHENGALDTTFGANGCMRGTTLSSFACDTDDCGYAGALQADGSIVTAGKACLMASSGAAMARFVNNCPYNKPSLSYDSVIYANDNIPLHAHCSIPALMMVQVDGKNIMAEYSFDKPSNGFSIIPALHDGDHTCMTVAWCPAANLEIASSSQKMLVDKNPKAAAEQKHTPGFRKVMGMLPVRGGSGNYEYEIVEAVNGKVSLQENAYTFEPSIACGTAHFTYKIKDTATHGSSIGRIDIDVQPQPVANNGIINSEKNKPIFAHLNTLIPVGVPPYEFSLIGKCPANLQLEKCGNVLYTPEAEFCGEKVIKYYMTDANQNKSNVASVTLGMREKPAVHEQIFGARAGKALNKSLAASVARGKAPYRFNLVNGPKNGSLTLNEDGTFDYVGNRGMHSDSFEYQVLDAHNIASDIVTAHIKAAPITRVQNATFNACQNHPLQGTLSDRIISGDGPYQYFAKDAHHGDVVVNTDGSFIFTPEKNYNGVADFSWYVLDRHTYSSPIGNAVISVKLPPTLQGQGFKMMQNQVLSDSLAPLAQEGVAPYEFVLSGDSPHGAARINPDGTFTFSPAAGFHGSTFFIAHVKDAFGCESQNITMPIEVMEIPKVANKQFVVMAGTVLQDTLVDTVLGGKAPYVFSVTRSNDRGVLEITPEGLLTFSPARDFVGITQCEYMITDANGLTSSAATAMIDVRAPLAVNNAQFSICQYHSLIQSLLPLVSGGVEPYHFAQAGIVQNGVVSIADNGTFSFKPTDAGAAQFQFEASDSASHVTDVATVDITVLPAPQSVAPSYTSCINGVIEGALAADNGTPPYRFKLIGKAKNGTVRLDEHDGSFVFVPTAGFNGQASFNYMVKDANNCISALSTVSIVYNAVPQVVEGAFTSIDNKIVKGSLQSLVVGGLAPFTFVPQGDTINGVATVYNDGNFAFSIQDASQGNGSFQFSVVDANGCSSNTATVTIAVSNFFADNQNLIVAANGSITGALASAIDGGTSPYSFASHNASDDGVVLAADGTYSFAAPQDFVGVVHHAYIVTDSNGLASAPATLSFDVKPPLIVANAQYDMCQYNTYKGSLVSLVQGGFAPYQFALVQQSADGTAVVNPDGSFSYRSVSDGIHSFEFSVTDALGSVSTATINFTIDAAPQAQALQLNACPNAVMHGNLSVLGGVQPYDYKLVGRPKNGTVLLNKDGSFVFTPTADFSGQASFAYMAKDANGCISSLAQVQINYYPAIVVVDGSFSGDDLVQGDLTNLVSGGLAPYTFVPQGDTSGGTALVYNDGKFSFTFTDASQSSGAFQFSIVDANGCSSNTATVMVQRANKNRNLKSYAALRSRIK